MAIEADLQNRRVTTFIRVPAPKQGGARGRIGWMLRQLKDAPSDLRIEVSFPRTSETTTCLLPDARENPKALLSASDPKREPRAFDLLLSRPMGKKRGRGRGSFVGDTRRHGIEFYRQVVQDLKHPPAPKLSEESAEAADEPQPVLPGGHESSERERALPPE